MLTAPYYRPSPLRLESLAEAEAILGFARAEAGKRARHLQHPLLCLDAIQTGEGGGGSALMVLYCWWCSDGGGALMVAL